MEIILFDVKAIKPDAFRYYVDAISFDGEKVVDCGPFKVVTAQYAQ